MRLDYKCDSTRQKRFEFEVEGERQDHKVRLNDASNNQNKQRKYDGGGEDGESRMKLIK